MAASTIPSDCGITMPDEDDIPAEEFGDEYWSGILVHLMYSGGKIDLNRICRQDVYAILCIQPTKSATSSTADGIPILSVCSSDQIQMNQNQIIPIDKSPVSGGDGTVSSMDTIAANRWQMANQIVPSVLSAEDVSKSSQLKTMTMPPTVSVTSGKGAKRDVRSISASWREAIRQLVVQKQSSSQSRNGLQIPTIKMRCAELNAKEELFNYIEQYNIT